MFSRFEFSKPYNRKYSKTNLNGIVSWDFKYNKVITLIRMAMNKPGCVN